MNAHPVIVEKEQRLGIQSIVGDEILSYRIQIRMMGWRESEEQIDLDDLINR